MERAIVLQLGYLQKLPADHVGERHVVTVSQLPDGKWEWEERPGPAPTGENKDDGRFVIRLNLVRGQDGSEMPYTLGDAWRELAEPQEGRPN